MIFSCKRASELCSKRLDSPLHLGHRLTLGIHLFMCPPCRRFREQLQEVDRAAGELLSESPPTSDRPLSDEAKGRIKQALSDERKPG